MRIVLISLLFATTALAEEFGARGTVVIDGGGAVLSVLDETTFVSLAPAATLFVREDLSVGLGLSLGTSFGTAVSGTTLGARTSVGYNLPLGGGLSLWPRAALSWSRTSFSGGSFSSVFSSVGVAFDAHLLFHPAPHFFVGVGPGLSTVLWSSQDAAGAGVGGLGGLGGVALIGISGGPRETFPIGLSTTFGGWF